jgi:hypothetical protein
MSVLFQMVVRCKVGIQKSASCEEGTRLDESGKVVGCEMIGRKMMIAFCETKRDRGILTGKDAGILFMNANPMGNNITISKQNFDLSNNANVLSARPLGSFRLGTYTVSGNTVNDWMLHIKTTFSYETR